jgi:predicted transcriptional regulator
MTRHGPRGLIKRPWTLHVALGVVVKHHRLALDLTQTEAAEPIGFAQSMWARLELGSTDVPLRHILEVSQRLQLSASKLLAQAEKEYEKGCV